METVCSDTNERQRETEKDDERAKDMERKTQKKPSETAIENVVKVVKVLLIFKQSS